MALETEKEPERDAGHTGLAWWLITSPNKLIFSHSVVELGFYPAADGPWRWSVRKFLPSVMRPPQDGIELNSMKI
jgi:hypothetical protein